MSSEIAFNAYVFLPNALALIEKRVDLDYANLLGATREQVAALHSRILAPNPGQILDFIRALSPAERTLLIATGTLCLTSMHDDELAATMGLPRVEVESVLNFISSSEAHA